ncbi:hypothetical protein MUK70_10940 [Dyadobacter chenwenxiniae]|uniref:Uncharacterized protein n=1 Tax=Dyadobacter chenwenxiniae TaxID=2906456 RepID=A0A9X1TI84_9BACT|nr:hypothetical protein [Dyadobacter chenwenxiniae]MCF0065590.1 hypothetical protein [Dyadobacter chenwenxiniae]UON85501.1 hypothetical protein MUK70_10940 [Dyadobacter chenwenxiniae]
MPEATIIYKYKFSENYNPVYANGAHGGVAPQGEIMLNFFLERQSIPKKQTFEIKDNQLGNEIAEKAEPHDFRNSFIRYIETGVVLNLKTARDVKDFLEQQINLLEGLSKNEQSNNPS